MEPNERPVPQIAMRLGEAVYSDDAIPAAAHDLSDGLSQQLDGDVGADVVTLMPSTATRKAPGDPGG